MKRIMLTWEHGWLPSASIWVAITMLCTATSVWAEEGFKHLSAVEIKKAIVGKTLTDGPHWADKFKPDGTLESIMHGYVQQGHWSARRNALCMAYPNGKWKADAEECFEVWRRGHVLEYRRNGNVIAQGELVNR